MMKSIPKPKPPRQGPPPTATFKAGPNGSPLVASPAQTNLHTSSTSSSAVGKDTTPVSFGSALARAEEKAKARAKATGGHAESKGQQQGQGQQQQQGQPARGRGGGGGRGGGHESSSDDEESAFSKMKRKRKQQQQQQRKQSASSAAVAASAADVDSDSDVEGAPRAAVSHTWDCPLCTFENSVLFDDVCQVLVQVPTLPYICVYA